MSETRQRETYQEASARREQLLLEHGTPVPARITAALGRRHGPQVDVACGTYENNPAGDVDAWEDEGDPRLPSGEQVRLLAAYTGYPIAWFYQPSHPLPGVVYVCRRTGRGRGCERIEPAAASTVRAPRLGQSVLPGMPEPVAAPKKRPAAPKKKTPTRQSAGQQQVLLGRMPWYLRAELDAKLAADKKPT